MATLAMELTTSCAEPLEAELSGEDVNVFPNPTASIVTIRSERLTTKEAQLIGLKGEGITKVALQQIGPHTYQTDLTHLTTGVYALKLVTSEGSMTVRLVKVN